MPALTERPAADASGETDVDVDVERPELSHACEADVEVGVLVALVAAARPRSPRRRFLACNANPHCLEVSICHRLHRIECQDALGLQRVNDGSIQVLGLEEVKQLGVHGSKKGNIALAPCSGI